MNVMQLQVGEFHQACDVPIESFPKIPPPDRVKLREGLILEEFDEFRAANTDGSIVDAADALIDLLYVTFGACLEYGIDAQEVFNEVHRSNMLKVGPDGKVTRRADGKILKPEGWQKPDIERALAL